MQRTMTRDRAKRPASPYLEILRLPGALAFSAAGFLARMPMSMFSLGTVLLIAATTGRYGLAGLVAAGGAGGYAPGAPPVARPLGPVRQPRGAPPPGRAGLRRCHGHGARAPGPPCRRW